MISGLFSLSFALAVAAADGAVSRDEAPAPRPRAPFEAEYLYSLSTNFGKVPFSHVSLSYDPIHKEIYVTGDGPIRVFNESGMEVYSFRDAPDLAGALSVAAMQDGDLVVLLNRQLGYTLVRCTFRGEVISEIVPRNVPAAFADLTPGIMRYANGRIYLSDGGAMRILVLEDDGEYVAGFDVAEKVQAEEERGDLGVRGFGVDEEGNMLFTIQPLFRAYLMSLDGRTRAFGVRGGAPGKFNVVGGIARDRAGNFYVADLLKSAVLVFDRDFRFLKEFGYRGAAPGSLAVPEELVVGGNKLYVSNRGRRGVSVFRIGGG